MSRFWIAFALTTSLSSQALAAPVPVAPCAETDLHCVLRLLDQKNEETKSWARENGLLKDHVATLTKVNDLLQADNAALHGAAQSAMDAIKGNQRSWYEAPSFLVPVGVVLGVGLTVLAVYGVAELQRSFPGH